MTISCDTTVKRFDRKIEHRRFLDISFDSPAKGFTCADLVSEMILIHVKSMVGSNEQCIIVNKYSGD